MNTIVPVLSALVSLAFALTVFDQYLARRKPYQLVWAIGLLFYCVATASEFVNGAFGLQSAAYRLWYLTGAVLVAAYLGMGTIYLLAARRAANTVMAILVVASVLAALRVFTSPVDLALLVEQATLTGDAFPPGLAGPRLLTPVFNVYGTVALVGGALYSAWVFWRRRIFPHRVASNILIVGGALLPALGGTFARFGLPQFLYILELAGIIIIFLGFLRSREIFGLYRFPLIHGLDPIEET